MDLGFTAAEEAFRQEVRGWLEANRPAEWRNKGVGGFREEEETDLQRQWQRRLHDAGWLKLAWPRQAGGREASPVMQAIYQEEMARAGAPIILGRLGVTLLAPTLLVLGSQWQKDTYVEKILSGELIFCQGFSEPDAGSDLAGLRTRAERRDGHWILNGQKTWPSEEAWRRLPGSSARWRSSPAWPANAARARMRPSARRSRRRRSRRTSSGSSACAASRALSRTKHLARKPPSPSSTGARWTNVS